MKSLISIIGFSLLVAFPFVISFFNSEEESAFQETSVDSSPNILQSISGVHMVENSGEKSLWELWAKSGNLNDKHFWKVSDIKVNFFADDGLIYEVSSPDGVIESSAKSEVKNLKLTKDVVTKTSTGYVFKSPSVEYKKETHQLFFKEDIKITGPVKGPDDILLTGSNMTLDLKTNEIVIHENVVARRKSTETLVLRSNKAFLNGQTDIAVFKGEVTIEMNEYNIQSEEVVLNFKNKKINTAVLKDNLKVFTEDKEITSNKMIIDFINKVFVFQGNSRLISGEDSLMGDEITISEDGKRIKISNAKANISPSFKPTPLRRPKID